MEAVIDFFTPARCIELLGLITGLCYLWFEYHANPLVWLVGIVMPVISMWVYFTKGLYADFGINIYYLVMAVYGYVAWTFNFRKKTKQELPVSRLTLRVGITLAVVAALLWALLAWILDCIHRLNSALCRRLHYRPEHRGDVDDGAQDCRTMAGVVHCGRGVRGALHLQRDILLCGPLYGLHHRVAARLSEMAAYDSGFFICPLRRQSGNFINFATDAAQTYAANIAYDRT